jgi:hypothetical protein
MKSVEYQKLKLAVGTLSGSASNTGNIEFIGRALIFSFACEDGSWFNAENLDTDDAYVFHYTDRDIKITPRNIFEPHVWGNGNVYYRMPPKYKFNIEEHGRGKVILY